MNLCLTIQAFQEAVHSQSYSYMLDSICSPQERTDILYQWKDDERLLNRNKFIGDLYNDFQTHRDGRHLMKTMMANYILEGIYFYSGFMFFYNLGRMGKMPGSVQEIRYINRDENTHLWLFRSMMGNLRSNSLGFGSLYDGFENEPKSMEWVSMYANANLIKTDFFEARSSAYAKSSALVDDL